MELIKEAVSKARAALNPEETARPFRDVRDFAGPSHLPPGERIPATPGVRAWSPPVVEVNAAHLDRNRVVSFAAKDPSHIAFNLLRTKVLKTMRDNGWKSLAMTSPTKGCGKTTVSLNLAFSLARQAACRTVLVDLDLRKAALARAIGVGAAKSIGQYLQGQAEFEECFVQIGDDLILGLNDRPVRNSAEYMHDHRLTELLGKIKNLLSPELAIFDLPPMLTSDDALAFLPHVDGALLVIEAGKTVAKDVEECEAQISGATNFLGVVFNKSPDVTPDYYYEP